MRLIMPIPESIKIHKPTAFGACEIRHIGGYYYVYPVTSKWDPQKGRSQKKTLKSVGKITEADGFIPNANGMRRLQQLRVTPETSPVVRNYGAYEVLLQLSEEISPLLKEHFPDCFREIRTLSLIRLVDGAASARLVQPLFADSYLSELCPDLAMSEKPVRKFISALGNKQESIDAFMRSFVLPGSTLLFNGTSIFWNGSDSLSAKGYNPEHRRDPQARILYIFEQDSHKPVFYRVVQGSIVDKTAFIDTVRDSGCRDCTIIADKGFYSKRNLSALTAAKMRFILPLQSNTINVEPEFYEKPDDHKFDGAFAYKRRMVWYRKRSSGSKGNFIYTFRDDLRRTTLQAGFVERAEKDYGEEEYQSMDVLDQGTRMGYFSFCSNIDTSAEQIYLAYKERWDIEQCFDYLKNNVVSSASHAQNDDYFRGWAFLNHVSLLYFYGLLNTIREKDLNGKYSAADVLKLTKNIYKVDSGDGQGYRVSAIQKKTQKLLNDLGVDLLRKN